MSLRRQVTMLVITLVVIIGTFVATLLSDNRPSLGLDLQGGVSVTLEPVAGSDLSTLDTATQIIRRRVDGLGIAEPEVSRQGNLIVVDLPGAKNQQEAKAFVGKTAELRFRPVQVAIPYSPKTASTTTTAPTGETTTAPPGETTTAPAAPDATTDTTAGGTEKQGAGAPGAPGINAQLTSVMRPAQTDGATPDSAAPADGAAPDAPAPADGATTDTTAPTAAGDGSCQNGKLITPPEQNTAAANPVILPDRKNEFCYVLGETLMTGRDIESAQVQVDQQGQWEVNVTFKNDDFVTKVATPNVGKQVAITLDQQVESAPTIRPGITGRTVTISGDFTKSEADELARSLKYGSLPVVFKDATSQSVSPTLGKDQLHAGIVAGLIGLALVALYMIIFYRLLGLVVWIGLGLTGMVFFTLVSWLSATQGLTLTLSGVTGLIVSVGVTVDSYVVYFERLKDEVRQGKTVRSSLDVGFTRAFRTILAADLVSLLGAAVLYFLAAGSVRFFAYFLGLSTLIDLILAYTFMHPLCTLLARRPALVRMKGVGIAAGLDAPGVRA